jgi:putative salt-induced outer membrane protein YdiY
MVALADDDHGSQVAGSHFASPVFMQSKHNLRLIPFLAAAFAGAASLSADIVETNTGAHITGRITAIDSGSVVVKTDYAGTITIKQSAVTLINTDEPVAVRLASGTRFDGRITGTGGRLQITNPEGTVTTTVDKIAASWEAGGRDPLERRWEYEASADITGKSGNKSQLGTAAGVRATLKGVRDTLAFYAAYDRQVTDDTKSSDQFKAGVDYANNFADAKSWYVRDEGGFDRIKDIEFYNVAAAGLGYDFIKKPTQTLTVRVGLSFRNENYRNPLTDDVNAAGLDFGLNHTLELANLSLVNRVAFVPSFSDFSNYRATHESFLEVPTKNPNLKLRVGVSNDYNSQPGVGVKKLDTSYFSRLVLDWK